MTLIVLSLVTLAAGVYLLIRNRISVIVAGPRCPHCTYLAKGLTSARCPECGKSFSIESATKTVALRRWKHRLGVACIALSVICFSYALLTNGNWTRITPTWLLIKLYPHISTAPEDATTRSALSSLMSRMKYRSLSDGQLRDMLTICANGDSAARPGSQEWDMKYGNLVFLYYTNYDQLADEQAILGMLPATASCVVVGGSSGNQVLANCHSYLAVECKQHKRVPKDNDPFVRLTSDCVDGETIVRPATGVAYLQIPPLTAGKQNIGIVIETGDCDDTGLFIPNSRAVTSVSLVVVSDTGAAEIRDNSALTALQSAIHVSVKPFGADGSHIWQTTIDVDSLKKFEMLRSVLVGATVELFDGRRMLARCCFIRDVTGIKDMFDGEQFMASDAVIESGRISVQIKSEIGLAWSTSFMAKMEQRVPWHASRYWVGVGSLNSPSH